MADINRYEVIVELKKEVLDPEGRAIQETLVRLGHKAVQAVDVSKRFVLVIDGDVGRAEQLARELAREFLANPISQTFQVKRLEAP